MERTEQTERNGIRLLRADEIECRVGTASEKGISLLLFKDARVDQKILDEMFTPFGWKRSHQVIDGNLYCTVEVWDEKKGQWIGKQDVGTMSYSEKEKGQASDSFKRACVNWGIGRELYTAPFIWIPADKVRLQKKGDKYVTYDQFAVYAIGYSRDREICSLEIRNGKGIPVFSMQSAAGGSGQGAPVKTKGTGSTAEVIKDALADKNRQLLLKELERTGVSLETVLQRYQISELGKMTPKMYQNAISGLRKSKDKAA